MLFLEPSPSFSLSSYLSCKFRSHSFQEFLSDHLFAKDVVLPGSELEVEALGDGSLLLLAICSCFSLDFFHPHDQTFSIFCNFSVSLCALFLQSNVLVLILQDMWNNRLLLLGFLPPLFKGLLTTYADIIFLREMGQGFLWMLLTLWGLNQQDTVVSTSYLFIYLL